MILNIALLSPPWSTYSWLPTAGFPETIWKRGLRVLAPLGKGSTRVGIIQNILTGNEQPDGIRLKTAFWPLEREPLLTEEVLSMVEELSKRQGLEPGYILGHVVPVGLRSENAKFTFDNRVFTGAQFANLPESERSEAIRNFVEGKIQPAKKAKSADLHICLLCKPPWQLNPVAVRQKQILDILWQHGPQTRLGLEKLAGVKPTPAVNKLLAAGLVEERERETGEDLLEEATKPLEPNETQRQVIDELSSALIFPEPQTRLLFGITGSGKTAVYIELVRRCLEHGKSAIVLAPEVALAQKLNRDFQAAFSDREIILYHGYQSAHKRENTWRRVASLGKPCIIIGTRSAIFIPVSEPGCIILDEEHDASYKQDEIFAYNAKELAWYRIAKSRGLLLLGSATPDVRSFEASESGAIKRLEILRRASGGNLPPVEIVDIGKKLVMGAEPLLLGGKSRNELEACAKRGEQAVILLNRRGYAPLIFCIECGKTIRCPNCAIGLSYHKDIGKLICHYCGYSVDYPVPCPDCGKMRHVSIGEGTERLAEKLEAITGKEILRLDRDNTRSPGKTQEILEAFARNESPFLAGTQMLSKGHHFPNVTLVVVADGDIGLNMPDYRAGERTFQLLVQAAGRAGRGAKPGKVLIQTRNPDHYCWQFIRNHDYRGFYEEEMRRRQRLLYPPFIKLGLLRFSCAVENVESAARITEVGRELRETAIGMNLKLLGPTLSPIAFIRGRRRFQCLMKGENWAAMRDIYYKAAKLLAKDDDIRIFLDIDPVNMM